MKKLPLLLSILGVITMGGCNNKNPSLTSSSEEEKPIVIGEYKKFDLDTWMRPIWSGRVMHNETVSLIGLKDKAKLLFKPEEIVSVRDYTLKTEYTIGVDYVVDSDGYISLKEGTKFPFMTEEEYYSGTMLTAEIDGDVTPIYYGEDFYKTQLAVTYVHDGNYEGFIPTCYKERFQSLIAKFNYHEDVTFIFFGDSITYGCNASEYQNIEPFTKTYTMLFTEYVAKIFGYKVRYINPEKPSTYIPKVEEVTYGDNGTITFINPAVGGWTSTDGVNNFNDYIKPFINKYGCDLFVCAFGMNDGNKSPDYVSENVKTMLDNVLRSAPNANLQILATMIPNPILRNDSWAWNLNQRRFESKFIELSDIYYSDGISCGVCQMTSLSKSILETKTFKDITGNNVNHPSDFFVRVYAQALYQSIFGYDN